MQFQTTVVNTWMLLPTLLNQTSKGVCGIFHSIFVSLAQAKISVTGLLLTAEARDMWESDFNNCISTPFRSFFIFTFLRFEWPNITSARSGH
jgi:hypothetical protein